MSPYPYKKEDSALTSNEELLGVGNDGGELDFSDLPGSVNSIEELKAAIEEGLNSGTGSPMNIEEFLSGLEKKYLNV